MNPVAWWMEHWFTNLWLVYAGDNTVTCMGVERIQSTCVGSCSGLFNGHLSNLFVSIRTIDVVNRHGVWVWTGVSDNYGWNHNRPNSPLLDRPVGIAQPYTDMGAEVPKESSSSPGSRARWVGSSSSHYCSSACVPISLPSVQLCCYCHQDQICSLYWGFHPWHDSRSLHHHLQVHFSIHLNWFQIVSLSMRFHCIGVFG